MDVIMATLALLLFSFPKQGSNSNIVSSNIVSLL